MNQSDILYTSWDAALDDFSQILRERTARRVAIIFANAEALIANHLQIMFDALEVLLNLSRVVERKDPLGVSEPILTRYFLMGTSSSYKSLGQRE